PGQISMTALGTAGSPWPDDRRFAVSVTFDGGYVEALEAAMPVLEQRRIPSTWFLVAGAVGGQLEGRQVATWDTWRELIAAGSVEVGNHTLTHPLVRRSAGETLRWAFNPERNASRLRRVASGVARNVDAPARP